MKPDESRGLLSGRWFLSCDWGTSALRLRLVDAATLVIAAETQASDGIGVTFNAWTASEGSGGSRWNFYRAVIRRHLAEIERLSGRSLAGIPLVMSGMASSSIGCREVPYKKMPFMIDGSDLRVEILDRTEDFPHAVVLISGACTNRDVMRGEETQLVGALAGMDAVPGRQLLVFPGTHSKHIIVENGEVSDFRTYMTGEFFGLLSRKSVLATSVESSGGFDVPGYAEAFSEGVRDGAGGNLLHTCFRVRVRTLVESVEKTANYHYLSGLIIGAEVNELRSTDAAITLVGSGSLAARYQLAFCILGIDVARDTLDADSALLRGQWTMASHPRLTQTNSQCP